MEGKQVSFGERLAAKVRSVIYTPIYLVFFVILMLLFMIVSWLPGRRQLQDFLIRIWAWLSLVPYGIVSHVEGLENVPSAAGFLYVFNHQSHFDIPVCCANLPRSFRFGAKIELYKIPLFGSVLRRMGALPIARQNKTEVFRVYEEAKERVRQGEVFILAPEGTRQEKPEIGPFKMGPFILAMDIEMPIVPVVLLGVYDVLAKGHLLINGQRLVQNVFVKVLPPVSTTGLGHGDRAVLQNQVREQMLAAYAELQAKAQG